MSNNLKTDKDYGKLDFFKLTNIFMGISLIVVIVASFIIYQNGFNYGIDFSGGTEIQVQFKDKVSSDQVRSYLGNLGYKNASVQTIGTDNEFLLRLTSILGKTDKETTRLTNTMVSNITTGFKTGFDKIESVIRRVDTVGPQIGDELKRNGLLAAFYCFMLILIYVGLRFDYVYAPGAVICLLHDAVITLGIFSLFGREVNVQTMAAILTIIGYSLNDTIVTYDRIRENKILYKQKNFLLVINRSLNDVLTRTMLTSVTTFLSVAAMYVWAGGVIKDFAFTLGIGVVVGTYSSIFIASPLVLAFDRWQNKSA